MACSRLNLTMPKNGAYIVSELPADHMVEIVCDKCGRKGRYRPATLCEKFGRDAPLPHVLRLLANCDDVNVYSRGCKVRYATQPWL